MSLHNLTQTNSYYCNNKHNHKLYILKQDIMHLPTWKSMIQNDWSLINRPIPGDTHDHQTRLVWFWWGRTEVSHLSMPHLAGFVGANLARDLFASHWYTHLCSNHSIVALLLFDGSERLSWIIEIPLDSHNSDFFTRTRWWIPHVY